ncbi:MAG: nodulation protein NfeD [Gammaproteobacteria bacterium]|nr:nodulation protein NfeD [Gammaproteobacteria bacterium]
MLSYVRHFLILACLLAMPATAQENKVVHLLTIDGAIGPATSDYLTGGIADAAHQDAALVIIRMNTPGGLDSSMRDIIQAILQSPIPVVGYVAPSGSRAASAGTYIMFASHIAAMAPATNIGSATPVQIGVEGARKPDSEDEEDTEAGDDESEEKSETRDVGTTAMERKTINDAVAYIRGLAELRSRNADWAEKAVREAVNVTASDALELGIIDLIAKTPEQLLQDIDGMIVEINGTEKTVISAGLAVNEIEPNWRNKLLSVITDPSVAYMLLMLGIYGLIFEGYNPGAVLPGVVGAISILLALYAFQILPVNYAGLGLIVLGVILLIAEVFAPSFGALGIGGVIALVSGSVILMDTDVPGYQISRGLIFSVATLSSALIIGIVYFAIRARSQPVVSGREQMIGMTGTARGEIGAEGMAFVHGELWQAHASQLIPDGQQIRVTGIDGLRLTVETVNNTQET